MKIAATYKNGMIFQHFGRTEQFKLYQAENGIVESAEVVDTEGTGHGALADFLRARGVEALICGGIGPGARMALAEPDAFCDHHEHEHDCHHGHGCGSHGCH